ncbi:hypothetical protein EYF80_052804 [Liparis tanakae]|uniref:Uncharacterized protein n=1 Tax=Liparis tanakae TaxID=230148 RepID=A0A4Z2F8A0_9TELE|nr:hypothetical protein EYF80_052804 [Liparis tanakae]
MSRVTRASRPQRSRRDVNLAERAVLLSPGGRRGQFLQCVSSSSSSCFFILAELFHTPPDPVGTKHRAPIGSAGHFSHLAARHSGVSSEECEPHPGPTHKTGPSAVTVTGPGNTGEGSLA